jgi:hypothetical protein
MQVDDISDCLRLLDLLGLVIDSNKGQTSPHELYYAEGIALKFFDHASLIYLLAQGDYAVNLPSNTVKLIVFPSINILLRAALEAFLTFHYLFSLSYSPEERAHRFLVWELTGYMHRQDFPILTEKAKEVHDSDKIKINELKQKLGSDPHFLSKTDKQRNSIISGNWKEPSRRKIANEAKLNDLIAIYDFLCGYAHTSSLSILQITTAHREGEQAILIEPAISTINVLIANMIYEYTKLFPDASKIILNNQDSIKLVNLWGKVGQG